MKFNERKLSVLELIYRVGSVTSDYVSSELNLEIHHARMCLLRYWKQRLLCRRNELDYKVYTITEFGIEKLSYLEELFSEGDFSSD